MTALKGKKVVVTRALRQSGELVELLKAKGAIPVLYPCIEVIPPADTSLLDAALKNLTQYDWLLLTSRNTVYILKERIEALEIQPDWSQISVAAVGNKTAKSAEKQLGLTIDFIPDEFIGRVLAQTLPAQAGQRIFLPQSALAKPTLADGLRARGLEVDAITAYDLTMGDGGEDISLFLQEKQIDAITFTSPSTIKNFGKRIAPLTLPIELPSACMGQTTADAAQQTGYQNALLPETNTLEGVITALEKYFLEQDQ